MTFDVTVFAYIAFGVGIAFLLQSNYRLRREVHELREQVSSLTKMLINKGADTDGKW